MYTVFAIIQSTEVQKTAEKPNEVFQRSFIKLSAFKETSKS